VQKATWYQYSLMAILLAILTVFMLWPIALTVYGGFVNPQGQFTLEYLRGVMVAPLYQQGLLNSFLIAICTTTLCLVLSIPLAHLSTRYKFPGKALLSGLVLLPLILPPFVRAIGLRALLRRTGAINSLLAEVGILDPAGPGIDFLGGGGTEGRFVGVVIAEALHLYPILYLNVAAAMANVDPSLDEAALGLGASRWQRFRRITIPLIMPGVFAGAALVFIWSFTELGTPLMFNYYTVTPVQIFHGINEIDSNPQPYALVMVMLVAALGVYLLGKLAMGKRGVAMQTKASMASSEKPLSGWRGWGVCALFLGIIGIAVLPHLGVVFSSLSRSGAWYHSVLPTQWTIEHYQSALGHPLAMGSIQNSLLYATAAMIICVILGLCIAYLTVRGNVRGRSILDTLAMLPLAVPGLVLAFGFWAMSMNWPFPAMASFFREAGWDGLASLLTLKGGAPNPALFLILAYAIRRLPYVVRAASAGLEQTSVQLEEAALNLGASRFMTLRRIVAPLIMANLIAGGILAFSFSMLEVSDSLILAQKEIHFPITAAIYQFFTRLGDGRSIASAMGVWSMALLGITLIGASIMMGRRMGALFRV
jgi:iron(III) transport system permease protein